jgi:hypothetical protein
MLTIAGMWLVRCAVCLASGAPDTALHLEEVASHLFAERIPGLHVGGGGEEVGDDERPPPKPPATPNRSGVSDPGRCRPERARQLITAGARQLWRNARAERELSLGDASLHVARWWW